LQENGKTVCLYIDVSAETDLSGLNSGALLASFGLHLSRALKDSGIENALTPNDVESLKSARTQLKHFAYGKTEQVWVADEEFDEPPDDYDDYEPGHFVTQTTPGKLKPPFPTLHRELEDIRSPLSFFITTLRSHGLDTVVVFDGLDRLITPDRFWTVVHQDFRLLRKLNVAVLAAAPLSVLYGAGRPISEHFDRVHHIAALQISPGKTMKLRSVLTQRGAHDLLQKTEMDRVCKGSGGVLRDLISLARDAGEMAYLDGSDDVKPTHVRTAVTQLGQAYLRGLSTDQQKELRRLAKTGTFDISSQTNAELLVTRRVLEYSATGFRVHPALQQVMKPSK
jgi:hypothetical protein